jgi:glycerol-3-phosphate dehydrogenase (NAD(P)+)
MTHATGRKITVIGAGSWGTALAISLAGSGHRVVLWARRDEAAQSMTADRHNPTYLPDAIIPDSVEITSDLESAAEAADVWVLAVPSHALREVATRVKSRVHDNLIVVSVAKGIENSTLMTSTQVLADVLTDLPEARIGVLYGPSHAEEVAADVPTAVVAAANSVAIAEEIQDIFMTPRLRVYVNADLRGVEIAGSVKNVMAVAAGLEEGVGYGDNAKAALITRGIAEIRRLGLALGADASTFSGLAGIGDLVVTCMSRHSRNRYLGEQIGRGRSLAEVEEEMDMVAEGVRTTQSVHELARKLDIEMPITEAVYQILFKGKKPAEAVEDLMSRSAKREDWLPEPVEG